MSHKPKIRRHRHSYYPVTLARLRERGYDQDPPRDPFVAPPTRPAPRPRCHVSLEHEGVDLLADATPAEAAG